MTPLYAAAVEIQRFFRKKRWRFCIIGGLAVIRWGQPRTTKDVDCTLMVRLKEERKIIQALLREFEPRRNDAEAFALQNRVLLCNASNGVEIDIALAVSGFEEQVVERSSPFKFLTGCSLVTASAEDMVVLKAISDRSLDWTDLEGILVRQQGRLDWHYILSALEPLCELKEDASAMERLESLRLEIEQSQ